VQPRETKGRFVFFLMQRTTLVVFMKQKEKLTKTCIKCKQSFWAKESYGYWLILRWPMVQVPKTKEKYLMPGVNRTMQQRHKFA